MESQLSHQYNRNLDVAQEAMDLLVEWWPKPYHATVTLETHQWERLRALLLAVAGKEDR